MSNGLTTFAGEPTARTGVLPGPLQGRFPLKHDGIRPGLAFTETDANMLSAAEVWGVLGAGQLMALHSERLLSVSERGRLFFNKFERRAYASRAWKRITELVQAGFLRRVSYPRCQSGFLLTWRGHAMLARLKWNKLPKPMTYISEKRIEHEISVAAVGLILKTFLGLEVGPPIRRRRAKGSPSIADIVVDSKGASRVIEVELTLKSAEKYRDRWPGQFAFYQAPILYLTDFNRGIKPILAMAKRSRADYVYACTLDDFKDSMGAHSFENYLGGRIDLPLKSKSPAAAAKEFAA